MRTIGLLAMVTVLAIAPLSVQAQTAPVAPAPAAPVAAPAPAPTPAPTPAPAPAMAPAPVAAPTVFGLPPGQALAIGVGMAAGGVGVGALAHGPFSTLIGAAAGALIGDWWYATKPTPMHR